MKLSSGAWLALAAFALVATSVSAQAPSSGALPGAAKRPPFDIHAPIDPSRGDALSNPAVYHTDEVLKFVGVKRGWRIADIFPGRFTPAFARVVGPTGHVVGFVPEEIFKVHPALVDLQAKRASDPAWAGVEMIRAPLNDMTLPNDLDAVFIRQNYHDLHVRFLGPADVPTFNKKVFAALKPGGEFIIIDHVAPTGIDEMTATNRLHRINPADVRKEVEAAGFKFEGESNVLADSSDDHTHMVLETTILGMTDQFMYRFRKPR